MKPKADLTLVVQPEEYFHQLVTRALANQKVSTRPETEHYLVCLLNQFITTDSLFARDTDGNYRSEPLAVLLKEALEQTSSESQMSLFRRIGDISLYVAGYFQESLNRKLVDVDYYIEMGRGAYARITQSRDERMPAGVYSELAHRFGQFVDVLAEVSEKTTSVKNEVDILRMYEVWVRTRSEKAEKVLRGVGIFPTKDAKKGLQ